MADAPLTACPKCGAPCTTTVHMRGGDHGWGTTDAERTTYRWAPPSPPVAAPAEPVTLPAERDRAVLLDGTLGFTMEMVQAIVAADRANRAPQPTLSSMSPLSDAQIELLRKETFSTNNPFCPCDSKTMRKAVWAAERAHGIGPTTPTKD